MKVLLLVVILFSILKAKAEETMFNNYTMWSYYYQFSFDQIGEYGYTGRGGFVDHAVIGTVEVSGNTYYELATIFSLFGARQHVNTSMENETECGIVRVREENGRIYVIYKDYIAMSKFFNNYYELNLRYIPYKLTEDGEMILYDFTMQIGDKFQSVEGYDDIIVSSISEVTDLKGKSRKLLTLSNGCKIVEGIGCITPGRLLLNYLNPEQRESVEGSSSTTCFYRYGTRFSRSYDFNELVFSQTQEDIELARKEMETMRVSSIKDYFHPSFLFDLQGRRIQGEPRKGVYVRGGKKYVKK